MKTVEEMIAVLTTFKEGRQIERKWYGSDEWIVTEHPCWNWMHYDYRVKE